MKFTALLSLYNKEKPEYLNECLESISNQSLNADEVVIVFDGYVEKELSDVVDKWCNILPVKILKLAKNVGLGQALNKGLAVCKNDIIVRMDTDDICVKDRFRAQLEAFNNDESLALIGGHIEEFDETLNIFLGKRIVPIDYDSIRKKIGLKNTFNHMTVAFRKSAVLAVGGYKHHIFMEDYNLWLRLISAGYKVANLDIILVKARTGDSMLSRRKGLEYIRSEILLFKLKRELKIQSLSKDVIVLILRTVPRLMPSFILRTCYKSQRK